jgi:hypothetical protein
VASAIPFEQLQRDERIEEIAGATFRDSNFGSERVETHAGHSTRSTSSLPAK